MPNGKGGYFNHIQEMKDSYKALKKAKRSLEGSLRNPNLGEFERSLLLDALDSTKKHLSRIDGLFENYGGIEKWRKK